jgi:hypothetical protein
MTFDAGQCSLADFLVGDEHDPLDPGEDFTRW